MAIKCMGIKSKNEQQEQALKALLDPSIELVVLEGVAGSGKTLLTIAAGIQQMLTNKLYDDIIFTRSPIPLGEDIGFLPGTEAEKMAPWAGALMDNLEVLQRNTQKPLDIILKDRIKILAMMFMRGRSFQNRFIIVDESQNLTPVQIKSLVTRMGEGSKLVIMGDPSQIDNKKVTLQNNGLSYLASRMYKETFMTYIYLPAGERSQVATWAAEAL